MSSDRESWLCHPSREGFDSLMPYLLVLVLVLLAQTKLFSALQTPVEICDAIPTRPLSPMASRTRSNLSKELQNEFKPTDALHQGVEKSTSHATVTTCDVSVIEKNPRLILELPANLTSITKHHEDFIRWDRH